ncbi:MAG: hypothetical protein AB8B96_05405 [Lysobacterales bacterium]
MLRKLSRLSLLTSMALALSACQSVPVDTNRGALVTTPGVQRVFEQNQDVQEIVVKDDSDIRCIRERRVGTHMVTRICRTKVEWAALEEQTRYQHERRSIGGACGDTRGGGLSRCSEGRPGGGGVGF